MLAVAGLGNPGEKYRDTPHNLGRRLVEMMVSDGRLSWKKSPRYDRAGETPVFVRLNSYMNVSGEALKEFLLETGISTGKILVCLDDFDLPLGSVRIRGKGSAGSHNGMRSIIENLETEEIPRLRLGIGPVPPGDDPSDFVLKGFSKEKDKIIGELLEKSSQAVQAACNQGLEYAMNQFNGRDGIDN